MHRQSARSVVLLLLFATTLVALSGVHQSSADSLSGCSRNDITTGGGWVLPGGPAKRTFGLHAGIGPNAPVPGRLLFVDRQLDERLKGDILSYTPNPTNARFMMGVGDVNEQTVLFVLSVTDNSPGGADVFSLTYTTSEGARHATGPLGGGNIEIHPMCP